MRAEEEKNVLPASLQMEIVKRIKAVCAPVRVILFGSYAYGSPEPGSDIDILVIEKSVVSKKEESNKLSRSLADIPYSKDILVASQDEFDFYSKEAGSVFRTIAERGVAIYG